MRCAACLTAIVIYAAISPLPAHADDIPVPSFIDRGFKAVFGKDEDRKSGAYASPSASDLLPDPSDVGAAPTRGLQSFEPIALPKIAPDPRVPKIDLPGLPAYAPQNIPNPDIIRSRKTLTLEARLGTEGKAIPNGLVWRLFSIIPNVNGKLSLIASSQSSVANFEVPPGGYIVHVGFGRAGTTKRIDFTGEKTREVVVLDAGGLKLNAVTSDGTTVPSEQLRFDVYAEKNDDTDPYLIASDVHAKKLLRLNSGTYQVVSHYGSINAVARAEIRVESGRVTEATLQHHAAELTMKLVRETGGEAIADTAWSVSSATGDLVRESVGAFPTMILSEGEYLIVAKNRDKLYQRLFEVQSGHDTDVEVLMSDVVRDEGSGD